MQNVKIKTSDGREFVLTTEVAYLSGKIKEVCRQQGLDETVHLSDVNEIMFEKAIVWMEHYKDDPLPDMEGSEVFGWDVEYMKMERDDLFALTRAAYSLEVPGLVNLCCKAVANLIKGKSSAQIRGVFGLPRKKSHRRRPAL